MSLLPHLRSGGKEQLPDRYLFWDLYGQCGAARGPWKLVGEISNHHGRFGPAAAEAEKTTFALFNLEHDLGEKDDVSGKFPDIYKDLKTRHVQWLRSFATADDAKNAAPADDSRAKRKAEKQLKREKKAQKKEKEPE